MVIYLLRNIVNGKVYIGQTKNNLCKRLKQHEGSVNRNRNGKPTAISTAILKYGWSNFEHEILEETEEADLDMSERFWIRCYNSLAPNGYNLTTGGNTRRKLSEELRRKMSERMLGTKARPETIEKRRQALKGRPRPKEVRVKISQSHLGKKISEESRLKISIANKGKKLSSETKKKMSATRSGEQNNFAKMTWDNVREIRRLYDTGLTQKEIALKFGVHQGTVSKIVLNRTWKI